MIEFVLVTTWLFFANGTDEVFSTRFPADQFSNCHALILSANNAAHAREPNAVLVSECSRIRISEEHQNYFWYEGTES